MHTKDKAMDRSRRFAHDHYNDGQDKLHDTGEAIYKAAKHAKEGAADMLHNCADSIRHTSSDLQENAVTYVKKNPVKSVSLALITGLIAAYFLRK